MLAVLGQVLELASVTFVSAKTEAVLDALKVTLSISPCATLTCVRQLLKAIFGTNYLCLLSPEADFDATEASETTVFSSRPSSLISRTSRMSSISGVRPHFGLYQTCVSNPYTQLSHACDGHFVDGVAAASERQRTRSHIRKSAERRVASVLDRVRWLRDDRLFN